MNNRVVLMYHRIGLPRLRSLVTGQYVAPALFRSELGYLSGRGWTCAALASIIETGENDNPDFAITFDDGFASVYEHAFPILAQSKMTATVYVVASGIGGTNEWDQRSGDIREPMMSAAQIRQMADSGFEMGSHSLTHPHLSSVSDDDLVHELLDSKRMLEEIVGRDVVSFSYPYGDYDRRVADAVAAAGYSNAVCTRLSALTPDCGVYEIPRVNVRWNATGRHLLGKINRAIKIAEKSEAKRAAPDSNS